MKIALQLLLLIVSLNSFSQNSTSEAKATKEETKEYIIKTINEHGFEKDTFDKRYKASFEGDYLRLIVLRKSGKDTNDGILYDFSNVYKFSKVDVRSNKEAYVNIYVAISVNKTNTKWVKEKLVMLMDDSQIAETLFRALKHYNSFFVTENTDSRF